MQLSSKTQNVKKFKKKTHSVKKKLQNSYCDKTH